MLLAVEIAGEIDPLAAVFGPRLASKGLLKAGGDDFGFELSQVLAKHGSFLLPHNFDPPIVELLHRHDTAVLRKLQWNPILEVVALDLVRR